MTFHPNQDLKSFSPVPRWRYLVRDVFGALMIAAGVLGVSFAAGAIEVLLRRYL